MATIKNGVMGGFSGTVGTVVGGKWNGIDYMRGKNVDRKDSKSTAQLDQRKRFAIIIKFLKPLKPFLTIGFKNRKEGLTAYNAASSCNLQEALTGVAPDYKIDFTKVIVSQGPLPGAQNPLTAAKVAGQIDFSWENNSGRLMANANDKAIVVAYNQEKAKVVTSKTAHTRISGNHSLDMPVNFKGDTIHCYIAFQNAGETTMSNSQYAGKIRLL